MNISWKWLSELARFDGIKTPAEASDRLTLGGLEVEDLRERAKGFEKVVAVKILSRDKHPQADRLSVCMVTTGQASGPGSVAEPLQIVCGAQNMKAGDIVALSQVGAHLPNGMKIEKGKIRGVESMGMLCSETELGLKAESEGILILPPGTEPGRPVADVLGLDDTVFAIKLTANRGDCTSHVGVARELVSLVGGEVKALEVADVAQQTAWRGSPISVSLEADELCPQFWGVYLTGVKVGPSPDWVRAKLEAVGLRSINNVVDATNLLMMELGQPVHAYDADKIENAKIVVRRSQAGEKLPLLDGTEVSLTGEELVIADGKRAVGLAGVMGGGNSEISDRTTNVFLECAEFHPITVRRAASKFQKRTDASYRFERGVDPFGQERAISRLTALVQKLGGGTVKGAVSVLKPMREASARAKVLGSVDLSLSWLNGFLGTTLEASFVEAALKRMGCVLTAAGSNQWQVVPPSHRLDLKIPEDLAEEVARVMGYDAIPATLPAVTTNPKPNVRLDWLDQSRDAAEALGFSETVNFGFTGEEWLKKLGLAAQIKVINPLNTDLGFMTPSLLPGLIQNVQESQRHYFGSDPLSVRLFELRPTFHLKGEKVETVSEMETSVQEQWRMSFAMMGPKNQSGLKQDLELVDFFDVKGVLEQWLERLNIRGIRMQALTPVAGGVTAPGAVVTNKPDAISHLFHPGQTAEILNGNMKIGYAGLLHPQYARELKLKQPLWLFEILWDELLGARVKDRLVRKSKALPQFPPMERDFALVVAREIQAEKLVQVATKTGKPLLKQASVFDVYEGTQVEAGKRSIALRLTFLDEKKSLEEKEVEGLCEKIVAAWTKEAGATLRL